MAQQRSGIIDGDTYKCFKTRTSLQLLFFLFLFFKVKQVHSFALYRKGKPLAKLVTLGRDLFSRRISHQFVCYLMFGSQRREKNPLGSYFSFFFRGKQILVIRFAFGEDMIFNMQNPQRVLSFFDKQP